MNAIIRLSVWSCSRGPSLGPRLWLAGCRTGAPNRAHTWPRRHCSRHRTSRTNRWRAGRRRVHAPPRVLRRGRARRSSRSRPEVRARTLCRHSPRGAPHGACGWRCGRPRAWPRPACRHMGSPLATVGEFPQAAPAPELHAAGTEPDPGSGDDLVALGSHVLNGLQRQDPAARLAPTPRLRAVRLDGNDVAVGQRAEGLDDIAVVFETTADEVGEKGARGARTVGMMPCSFER